MKIKETMGIYEAKTRFSEVVDHVASGHSLTITKHGKPIARISPTDEKRRPRQRGEATSRDYFMADDFDAPLADFAEYQ
ncbi:MAG: prevent-host-death family protein [Kiritimatiellia bacterium]|jgi:prevent-host-death family protein